MTQQDVANTHQVKLVDETRSTNTTLQVFSHEVIMDAAERQGVELPLSCRAGACISCTGKLIDGSVEHLHCFLKRKEEEAGFILPCMAYPLSDCTILTHQEDALLDLSERI